MGESYLVFFFLFFWLCGSKIKKRPYWWGCLLNQPMEYNPKGLFMLPQRELLAIVGTADCKIILFNWIYLSRSNNNNNNY